MAADSRPKYGDSRRSGPATYPQARQPSGTQRGEQTGASMSGTGPNPNGSGPVMRAVSDECAGTFEDSNGFCQSWNEEQALDVPQPYAPSDSGD